MVKYYLVTYKNKKRNEYPRRYSKITDARKAAIKVGPTVSNPVYVVAEYADGSHGYDRECVEYYPGEGYVWRTDKSGEIEYYPIRKDGSLGKKHKY